MKTDLLEILSTTCDGNPGAANVLTSILKHDKNMVLPLCKAMQRSGSQAPALWVVYKDICKYDVPKTVGFLKDWYENNSMSLQSYLKEAYPEKDFGLSDVPTPPRFLEALREIDT